MSDANAGTPRVYIARHGQNYMNYCLDTRNFSNVLVGETEWTINGRYTGKSDIPLTPNGIKQVQGTREVLVGSRKLISPSRFSHVFVSPRQRALSTLDMLLGDSVKELEKEGKITVTEDIGEWDHGDYEGLVTKAIRELRKERGLDGEMPWDIWVDGCEGGE